MVSALPDTINSTYINQSSYWLTFFPLRGFLVLFDLAQVVNVIWIYIKTHLFGRTPRDIREWTQPPEFQYAIYYSNLLFMGAVGLVFAPLAPLVVLAAAAVLWMSSFVQKYQLMFVYITRVETGGRLWNVVVNRLLFVVVLMQLLMTLTIGLQFGFRTSFMWVSTLPPIVIIAGFKIYLSRTFTSAFRWYIPSAEELETAKIHSERADARANKLEKRFGHPALHSDLFTPMLHSNMMGLLGQVYSGKIARDHAKLEEYGGQKMEAQLVAGIKIAAIDQRDLEFDPTLYRKNQVGDDWDAQSIASTTVFGGSNASLGHAKSHYYASDAKSQRVPGYNNYLANGPVTTGSGPDIELARMDSMNEPLLSPNTMYFNNQSQASVASPPSMYREPMDATSQAPLYRPQGNFSQQSYDSYSPDSQYQPQQQQYPPQQFHRQDSSYSFRPESPGQQHPGRMSPSPSRFAASPAPQRMMTPNPQQQWGPDPRAGTPNPNNMAGRGTSNFRG
ncbi:unnamed protein product [Mycena citricolor]|uniref:CSC1/OSCA1-like 7TM region domain-containing protein n=1 Tax=Mycena citricolor TaxID=2018698 RepID=A0AAD2Q6P8_9AGAR|nr:unnamed protein product [Mycena citricolor]